MSTGKKLKNIKRRNRRMVSNQLTLSFKAFIKVEEAINPIECCPCCGASDYINACHYTCSHCGFAPACHD